MKDQNELVHNQSALFQVNIHQASINSVVYEEAVVSPSSISAIEDDRLMRLPVYRLLLRLS